MIRRAIKGAEVPPSIAMDILLYSYSKTFAINPYEAKDTPIRIMTDMLLVHGEVEKANADEIEKASKK